MSVPRWGFHQGIKFSPRRSVLKVCPICKEFFLKNTKGNQVYCNELCSIKGKQLIQKNLNQIMIAERDKLEHADYMRDLYAQGRLSKKKLSIGTVSLLKPKLNDDGVVDWNAYHQSLQDELHRLGLV